MIQRISYVAALLVGAQWLAGSVAAQAAGTSLSAEEDEFLSLLQRNVASGGPPKDGIPSIDEPRYSDAAEADEWLLPDDVVFGVDYQGFVAAYPQRVLVWHEIANETVGDERLSIT